MLAGVLRTICVNWDTNTNQWRYHATEEDAGRARSEYLEEGIDPVKHQGGASTSQFKGVCRAKDKNKWVAQRKGKYLGNHTTEEAAAHAYNKYLEDGSVPEPAERAGWGASQFKGVSWHTSSNKWRATCMGKHLGYHTTEEAAARAYSKYLEDGIFPEPPAGSSQFTGVSWVKTNNKWRARCNGVYLGLHTTEEDAARACSEYVKDGIVPAKHQEAGTSRFTGVSWAKSSNTWRARCKGTCLGLHATEEAATSAYIKYLKDGIDPAEHREACTSRFTGVCWDKTRGKWQARCKGKRLGRHTTEEAAARAYNVEAERVGRPLNVIPPVGAAS